MAELGKTLLTVGALLLVSLLADWLGQRTKLPRVTLLILFGVVVGPPVLDLLPGAAETWFPLVSSIALIMVGFLLGEKLTSSTLRDCGRLVLWISAAEVVLTAVVVFTGLVLVGLRIEIALLIAGIATATDPAATTDVVRESEADGPFSRVLLGVVAIDDAWGIIVFSIMLAAAHAISGIGGVSEALLSGGRELGGAVLIGVLLGIPMAYVTGRIRPGRPTLVEALGVVFVCGGVALWLEASFLLAAMVLGVVVANLAHHHTRPFHEIEGIEEPFLVLFFVLAGASLNIGSLSVGLIAVAYVVLRLLGRLVGGWMGGRLGQADPLLRRWIGLALMPQAGVALGLALIAADRFPDFADVILPVAVCGTVFFEILGPVLTRVSLERAGETREHGYEEPEPF